MLNTRVILDHTQAFYALLDLSGFLLEVNQSFLSFFGVESAPISNQPFWETQWGLDNPDSAIKLKNAVEQGVRGELCRFETERSSVDGRRSYIDFTVTPVYGDSNAVTSLVIEGRDNTDLKESQLALMENETRFRSLVELSSDWYWEMDEEYRFVEMFWSDGQPVSGFEPSPIGKRRWEFPISENDDMDWSHHQALLARHEPFKDFEYQIITKAGDAIWISTSGNPVFDSKNKFLGYRGASRNVTEQKRAELLYKENELRLRLAINISGIGIWEWDLITDQLIWDTKQFELFGLKEVDGSIPLSMFNEVIHPDDRVRLNKLAQNVQEGVSAVIEFRIIHPDGSVRWVLGHSGVVHSNETGSSAHVIGVNMDITKSKHIEMALRESQSQLQAANQTLENRIAERTTQLESEADRHRKTQSQLALTRRLDSIGQLAGGVAHDFNNLLAVIGGNLELAALYVTHDDVSEMIATAQLAVEAGTSVSQRLLAYARKQKLSPDRLSMNERVAETVHLLERTLGENFPITTHLDPNLWDTFVDAGEIDSALVNLALNARDAMEGGGHVTIETHNLMIEADDAQLGADDQPGEYVGIFVTDTGTGMSADIAEKALEPFFTTKIQKNGTGLGLSTVYGFVKESGGFLALDSHQGKGTTVRIHLPRAPEEIAAVPSTITVNQISRPNNDLILVVEDERLVRSITVKRLHHLGYRVLEVSNAQEAIDELEKGAPVDLVFTDIVMPGGITGYELADWLSNNRKDVKVLLTSGYIDPSSHINSKSTAPNAIVLDKPYSMDLLAQKVSEALEPSLS